MGFWALHIDAAARSGCRHQDRSSMTWTACRRLPAISCRSAGIEPWERLFQNLRASRETELANEYPLHVVTAWMGNTEKVASKHYLQVTDAHFEQALRAKSGATSDANVSKVAPHDSAADRSESQNTKQRRRLRRK